MQKRETFKIIVMILFLVISNYSFSQFYYFPSGSSKEVISGFKYKDNYYDSSPKGLRKFISETEMSESLKAELSAQSNRLSSKKTTSDVALYGGLGIGAGIFVSEVLSKKDGEQYKASNLFTGLGVAALGGIIFQIIKPKKKDYYNFINTFNNGKNDDKIKLSYKIDYSDQMNYGISLTF